MRWQCNITHTTCCTSWAGHVCYMRVCVCSTMAKKIVNVTANMQTSTTGYFLLLLCKNMQIKCGDFCCARCRCCSCRKRKKRTTNMNINNRKNHTHTCTHNTYTHYLADGCRKQANNEYTTRCTVNKGSYLYVCASVCLR